MKRIILLVSIVCLFSVAAFAEKYDVINQQDISIKAGPTEPSESLSMVWLESYLYPKNVKDDRVIALGVKLPSKVSVVSASFDFMGHPVFLSSLDGKNWTAVFQVPENTPQGLHIVRYDIKNAQGSIQRTLDFFVNDTKVKNKNKDKIAAGEATELQGIPLTVTATYTAYVDGLSRILYAGQKVTGISKVPFYKIILSDGAEGWVPATMVKEPVEEFYQLGYQSYKTGNYKAAAQYYKKTVAIDPGFVKGRMWLAKSYYKMGSLDAAHDAVLAALSIDDNDMPSRLFAQTLARDYYKIANAKFSQGRYNEAIAAYQRVLNLKPQSYASWIELGKSYEKLGFYQEARSAWKEALKANPEDASVYALLKIEYNPKAASAVAAAKTINLAMSPVSQGLPPALADDSLAVVKAKKTKKGSSIETALKSVIALTKSLGTPVAEKGWEVKKQGKSFLVAYLVEQGAGVMEAFEWMVDVDTKSVSAHNENARVLMSRW